MKGLVFTTFGEMIEQKFGPEVWDQLIERTAPESDGVYTAADTYSDTELFAYVSELSEISGAAVEDLVRTFGEYMMDQFAASHPEYMEGKSAKEFLLSIHDVVHVDVRKLHPGAQTPSFEYEDVSEDSLVMLYRSPRKLCVLAEGLIDGVAKILGTPISRSQIVCMHAGSDHCRFELKFG